MSEQIYFILYKIYNLSCSHAKLLQFDPTFWDPIDCSPPDSSVHGIAQARILEWLAVPFSRESSRPRDRTQVSFSH